MSGPSAVFKYLNTQSPVRYDQYEAVCLERDRARDVAVALEQELAALNLPAGHSPDPAGTTPLVTGSDPRSYADSRAVVTKGMGVAGGVEGEATASPATHLLPHRFRYDGTDEMYCRCGLPASNWRHDDSHDYRPRHAVTT